MQTIPFPAQSDLNRFIRRSMKVASASRIACILRTRQHFGWHLFRKELYPAPEYPVIGTMGNANDLAGYLAASMPSLAAWLRPRIRGVRRLA